MTAMPLALHHHGAWAADADRPGRAAEFERDLIRTRTGEGRERAKARGVKMGGESLADIGRSYNVSGVTISRLS
jgi:hypothetical protein